jgi:hypothetical protein
MGQRDNINNNFYCTNCGTALGQGVRFCSNCGTQVIHTVVEPNNVQKKKSPILLGIISLLIITFIIGFAAGGNETQAKSNSIENENTSTNFSAADYFNRAQEYYFEEKYYESIQAIDACLQEFPDSKKAEECSELATQIEKKLSDIEPDNGETLERTFKYQGSCILRAFAENGPAEITVKNKENPEEFVRFYVKEGETAEINLTGGTFIIEYKIGHIWFNDDIGFGEFCYEGNFDEDFTFEIETDNAWITSTIWEITV